MATVRPRLAAELAEAQLPTQKQGSTRSCGISQSTAADAFLNWPWASPPSPPWRRARRLGQCHSAALGLWARSHT